LMIGDIDTLGSNRAAHDPKISSGPAIASFPRLDCDAISVHSVWTTHSTTIEYLGLRPIH
jgi:hypothetical protein